MTIRCKFSPLGKPEVDSYEPGTVLFENSPANDKTTNVNLPIKQGVFELMCCSGGGGHWCYIGCNSGSSGSFFKGVVYFDEDQTLEIQVGGGTTTYAHNGYPTYITNCIHCPEGKSANTTCSSKPAAPSVCPVAPFVAKIKGSWPLKFFHFWIAVYSLISLDCVPLP